MTTTTDTAIVVGTYTLTELRDHSRSISETASRYEATRLEPGTYEVTATRDYLYRHEARLSVLVPGVVTSRYDGPEFFGVAFGSEPQYGNHRMVGEAREVRLGVDFDDVVCNEQAAEVLAWEWLTIVHPPAEGERMVPRPFKRLLWKDSVTRVGHQLEVPGELLEYFDDAFALSERYNELVDRGLYPMLSDVYCDQKTGAVTGVYVRRHL